MLYCVVEGVFPRDEPAHIRLSSQLVWCISGCFHPQSIDPESVEPMQWERSVWIAKLESLWFFFPSYLTLRHVHITWSPLTEEVIWSHGVLYSIYSSSIRGELKHQILHRLLHKSDLSLQPVPTPFHGWKNRWNQPAFCFFGLKWCTPCKEMRVDISETEHLTPEATNKFNKCGNKSQLELIK